jgi:hypothetical protein
MLQYQTSVFVKSIKDEDRYRKKAQKGRVRPRTQGAQRCYHNNETKGAIVSSSLTVMGDIGDNSREKESQKRFEGIE